MRAPRKLLTAVGAAAAALLAIPALATSGSAAVTPLVVSGYSDARVDSDYGIFSDCGTDLTAMLSDPANFGAGGTVERSISLASPGVATVTPGALDGVDVFFTGWVETSTYTADERTALLDYVLGGGAVIATTDSTDHDISDLFGVTLSDSSYTTATATALASPLVAGPFGTVSSLSFSGDQGLYTGLGSATEVAEADPNLGPAVAVIAPGALGAGSGPVVLVADVDVFTTEDCAAGAGTGALGNSVFVRNVFAYLTTTQAAVTPTTVAPTTTTGAVEAAAVAPSFTG